MMTSPPSLESNEVAAHIIKRCADFATAIEMHREELIDILLEYESLETAEDELWRSVDALRHVSNETQWLAKGKVELLCTFFPVNLPLYSLVIFAIIPSFMAQSTIIRPPVLARDVVKLIWEILQLANSLPNIKFVDLERSLFNEAFVSIADVVLFTGRYQNAIKVREISPNSLFIYNGAGVNPAVVTDTANVTLAAHKVAEARLFNSGQDCAGSDFIFIHASIADAFISNLLRILKEVTVGDYSDRSTRVGRIIKPDQLPSVKKFFDEQSRSILFGGKIDFEKNIVYPTIVRREITDMPSFTLAEFFSPVFNIVVYRTDEQLMRYFTDKNYSDFAMYVSIFSTNHSYYIPNSVILDNKIVNDVERAYVAYGGYGPKANFVAYGEKMFVRPLLISREISSFLQDRHSESK